MNPYASPDTVDTCRHDYLLAKRIAYSLAAVAIVYGAVAVGSLWQNFRLSKTTDGMTTMQEIHAFVGDWKYRPVD